MPSVLRMAAVMAAGGTAAAAYVFTDTKFQVFGIAMPAVRLFGAETAHKLTIQAGKYGLLPSDIRKDDPRLEVHLWGRKFTNPIGIAAGFDKDAEAMDGVLNMGVGFMEVGSLPPKPQPGNDAPRVFRLPLQNAVINRMGFNSKGIDDAEPRLQEYHQRRMDGASDSSKILMVNLGKNKETEDGAADFEIGVRRLLPYADAIVINVSSPNTPGLRGLQSKRELSALIKRVRTAMKEATPPHDPKNTAPERPSTPLLVKIAPDLSAAERADIAAVAVGRGTQVDGLIVSNTTIMRPHVMHGEHHAKEAGGLSGAPLMRPSTEILADMYRRTKGQIPLIGCGGVMSGGDAYLKIRAGASLVELYTGLVCTSPDAMVYKGPELIPSMKQELLRCLEADGFSCVEDAIGADHY